MVVFCVWLPVSGFNIQRSALVPMRARATYAILFPCAPIPMPNQCGCMELGTRTVSTFVQLLYVYMSEPTADLFWRRLSYSLVERHTTGQTIVGKRGGRSRCPCHLPMLHAHCLSIPM
jgi:hypothetical protein